MLRGLVLLLFSAIALVAFVATAHLTHCLLKCPSADQLDDRVVCANKHARDCDTMTRGEHVPSASWLDEIVRKAQHRCVTWEDTGRGWGGMTTCVHNRRSAFDANIDCAPFYKGMSTEALTEYTDLIKRLHVLSQQHQFDYSIVYGTALGYYRYNATLPWDDDVDVMVKPADLSLLQSVVRPPLCATRHSSYNQPILLKIYKCTSSRAGTYPWGYPYLDIFPQPPSEKNVFPGKSAVMHGITMNVPQNVEAHLTQKYGTNIKTECKSMKWVHKDERAATAFTIPCANLMAVCFPGYSVRYINLDKRTDRKALIIKEFEKQGVRNYMRTRAVVKNDWMPYYRAGSLACAQSHLLALQSINAPVAVVAEDDVTFVSRMPKAELENPSFDWDVLMLAYNGQVILDDCFFGYGQKWCRSGGKLRTTSFYAVKKSYKHNMIRVFGKSVQGMNHTDDSIKNAGKFAVDRIWWQLQQAKGHRWFAAVPRIAIQRKSYSDIMAQVVDYKV